MPDSIILKRKHKRVGKKLTMRFRSEDLISQEPTSKWDMVLLNNISVGGMLFLYDKEVKAGDIIEAMVNVPGEDHPIECKGMILRTEDNKESPFHKVAACFTEIDDRDRSILEHLVATC